MKTFIAVASLTLLLASCSQPDKEVFRLTSSKLDTGLIPKSIKYKGGIDTAVKFTDGDGEHVLITSEDDNADADNRLNGVSLYAWCYTIRDGKWKLAWQIQDMTGECEEDVAGEFIPKTFAITDLNNDGKAEVWLMYHLACRGDVSPSDMKVIMHEGAKKYAMRGGTRVKVNATDYVGGDYKFDAAFKNGPQAFREHAQELWSIHRDETFGEDSPNGSVK